MAFKAYIRAHGATLDDLKRIGHSLHECYEHARRLGMKALPTDDIAAVELIDEYYREHEFRYIKTGGKPYPSLSGLAFIVRATGGTVIRTGLVPATNVILTPGSTAWSPGSDRNSKENIEPVDPRDVLDRLLEVPIATWNLKSQAASIRHMGPMAQDIHAAFRLGESDRHISTIDADGIALAAIQGLNAKLEQRDAALRAMAHAKDAEIAALRRELADLRRAIEGVEPIIDATRGKRSSSSTAN